MSDKLDIAKLEESKAMLDYPEDYLVISVLQREAARLNKIAYAYPQQPHLAKEALRLRDIADKVRPLLARMKEQAARIRRLEAALEECADELDRSIHSLFDRDRTGKPTEEDMEPIRRARAALEGKGECKS